MIKCSNCNQTTQIYKNGYTIFQNKQQALRYVWRKLCFYEWLAVGTKNEYDITSCEIKQLAPPISLISIKRKRKKNGDIQVIFMLNRPNAIWRTASYTITEVEND